MAVAFVAGASAASLVASASLVSALRREGLPHASSALVLGCGTGEEAAALAAAAADLSVTCVEASKELSGVAATLAGSPPAFRVVRRLPRDTADRYGLALVTALFFHRAQRDPAAALGRLRQQQLAPDALLVVACDGAVGSAGVSHVRRMLELLSRGRADDTQTRLHLGFSLLQSLPPSHYLRQ